MEMGGGVGRALYIHQAPSHLASAWGQCVGFFLAGTGEVCNEPEVITRDKSQYHRVAPVLLSQINVWLLSKRAATAVPSEYHSSACSKFQLLIHSTNIYWLATLLQHRWSVRGNSALTGWSPLGRRAGLAERDGGGGSDLILSRG